ncbi:MAG TPA: M1 family metallopeptidase [Gemmatimonadaceae bacterium]|nr:M1 family metallopeptidase [Gemmatimonadaceae bacterium]
MTTRLRFLLPFLFAAAPLQAQRGTATPSPIPLDQGIRYDRTGVGDTSLFAPLDLPPGNEFRSGSGAPGPKYWQNHADYDIQASLDTGTKTLTGTLTLHYTNNSPDTLHFIWIQTEQNAFKDKSLNSFVFPAESRFGARGFEGGDVITRFDEVTGGRKGRHVALKLRDNGTVTKVDLAEPLAPGKSATFDVAWHFLIPEHGADRMGRDGPLYELAQWYPRVNVYDDLRGWNTEPYLGQGEFYLEYGDYNVAITVPAGYTVASTGTLQNAREVLTSTEISRLAQAAKSATPVNIITLDEMRSGAARPRTTGTMTWKFAAKNVRDVAWAGSPEYLWDASSYKGIITQAYYRPSAVDPWKDAADQTRMSIDEYSNRWYPYPWPQMSAVEGPISGMEYPMLVMEAKSEDKYDLYNVVTHEIGHNWFPMLVGSNERMHMWQDEGFNTFINTFSEARRYPEKGDQMQRAAGERSYVEQAMQHDVDVPIDINPDRIDPRLLGLAAYVKPSVGLQLLRQEIMGPEAFDDAFRTYIKRWAYKHPSPADFYRTMEDVGGKRLDWFWREWFIENPHFDQAIDSVGVASNGNTQHVTVVYGNRARGVLPIHARFTFSDGSTAMYDYPAEVWSTNTTHYARTYDFAGKTLSSIELDPNHRLVDVDRTNNSWRAGATRP